MSYMSFIRKLLNKLTGKAPFCSAVIAAAGSSRRMEGEDKLFIDVFGIPVIVHTLIAFQKCGKVDEIVIVARDEKIERVSKLCLQYNITKATKIMAGGPTRLESVMNGVLAVSNKAQIVAIHDGARPCVSMGIIDTTIAAAIKYHAAAPAVPVISTLKHVKKGMIVSTVDRECIYEIQTPQVFTVEIIKAALTKALDKSLTVTDDCMAAELMGVPARVTEGSRNNIKLTTREDVLVAEAILREA